MARVIDVWMQHPTARFLKQPCLASLLRGRGARRALTSSSTRSIDSLSSASCANHDPVF